MRTFFHAETERLANREDLAVDLQVNCAGEVSGLRSFRTQSVRRDFYCISLCRGQLDMEGTRLLPGDILIFEPGHPYRYQGDENTEYLWVHFTGSRARELALQTGLDLNRHRRIGVREDVRLCFEQIFREFMVNDSTSPRMLACLLEVLLLLIGRYAVQSHRQAPPLAALSHIHAHYYKDLRVDTLAKIENMSPSAFRAAFRQQTGLAPNEYIIRLRISTACRLLRETHAGIAETAAAVGYPDAYYLSRLFKQRMGVSPRAYRRSK